MELDWSIGQIVDALKAAGVYENTLILFTSDNGPQKGSAAPLRGKKATTWEGGQRVPAIMSWPAKIPEKSIQREMVTSMDLLPTFASISNGNIPEGLLLDGIDISKVLFDRGGSKLPERPFYYYARNGELEAVRIGKWKLHMAKSIGWPSDQTFETALYDLDADISEQKNIAHEHPEIVEELKDMMLKFDASIE
jgi:arylsulfatase A-like enzyme